MPMNEEPPVPANSIASSEAAPALTPDKLRLLVDPGDVPFASTADAELLEEVIGQGRAVGAIELGIDIDRKGYNVFALGPTGTGRHTVVRAHLVRRAQHRAVPNDLCYVHNFASPESPRALVLPTGEGARLRETLDGLIAELEVALPAAFDSDEYKHRREALEQELKAKRDEALAEIEAYAKDHSVAVIQTPMGFGLAALKRGEMLDGEAFSRLADDERETFETHMKVLRTRLEALLGNLPRWQREHRERLRRLDRSVSAGAVNGHCQAAKKAFATLANVQQHLEALEADVIDNTQDFLASPSSSDPTGLQPETSFRRYRVNVLVDRREQLGAPVIQEDHPSVANLVGRIDHRAQLGTLTTSFDLIKAGALHRANGGFLLLDAQQVLREPMSWEVLKRCLRWGEIRIDSLAQAIGLVSTTTLEPEPIPLDVKVILFGERRIYYLLSQLDPEFAEHFKIAADFADEMDRTAPSTALYARLIATMAREKELLCLDRDAVARVIEQGIRLAEDREKLSMNARALSDLLVEADHWARKRGQDQIAREDVERAVILSQDRQLRLRDKIQESIARGTLRIETDGKRVGSVNGLSVISLGDVSFGRPTRITARVRLGKGEVIDIEREVELGGPIHSKGVLILGGFLGGCFAVDSPLSLRATLVFEQSYGGVDGDSASLAELVALLSALADAPIDQSFALTGSIDQQGHVQAIGGVNEKVEGYFDVCQSRGLTGRQGVLIPASNVPHLMLRTDVVAACAAGRFHVHPVATVGQALALLAGQPTGERDAHGAFPNGSLFGRVEARLNALSQKARDFSAGGGDRSIA